MFYSGLWYKNSEEEECLLRGHLGDLIDQKKLLQSEIAIENISERPGISAGADEEFIKRKKDRLNEVSSKIIILTNALQQMGFSLNSNPASTLSSKPISSQIAALTPTISNEHIRKQMEAQTAIQNALQQISNLNQSQILPPFSFQFPPFETLNNLQSIKDGEATSNNNKSIVLPPISSLIPPRIQSSNHHRTKGNLISCLNERYEKELDVLRTRCDRRHRVRVHNRIYHIEPDLSEQQRYEKTDNETLKEDENGFFTEHVWKGTIDEALESYIDGDILQLAEGRHVVSGKYVIYGTLTIRGMASSNWKTLIINKWDSDHFIWCIGKAARVTFENLLLRNCGAR